MSKQNVAVATHISVMSQNITLLRRTPFMLLLMCSITLLIFTPFEVAAMDDISVQPTVTIATWNTKVDNKSNIASVSKQLLLKADVLGLQEVHSKKQRARIKAMICKTCAYGGYMAKYSGDKTGPASYPIIWNKSKYSMVGVGHSQKVTSETKLHKQKIRARYITWVILRDVQTGHDIYVINTHFIRSVEYAGLPGKYSNTNERYQQHMQKLVALLAKLQLTNIPIYLTGDFAVSYRDDALVRTNYFPYAALRTVGVISNWELTQDSDGFIPYEGTYLHRLIDYVMVWQRSDVMAISTSLAESMYGSDHYPVFFTVQQGDLLQPSE